MSCIHFGNIRSSLYYPILFTYFLLLESFSIGHIQAANFPQVLLITIFFTNSAIISGIFEIAIYLQFKLSKRKSRTNLIDKQLISNWNWKFILLFLLTTILDSGTTFFFIFKKYIVKKVSNPVYMDVCLNGINLFLSSILCFYFLDIKLENHKKGGMAIASCGFILNFLISFLYEKEIDFTVFFIQIAMNFGTSIQEVLEKYFMHHKYQSPFTILFFEGIIGNAIVTIALVITIIIDNTALNSLSTFFREHWITLFTFSSVCVGYSCFRLLINRDYTPTHRVNADTFASLCFFIISISNIPWNPINLVLLIGFLIINLGNCIYNEIIIINFYGLNKDTQNQIHLRGNDESNMVYDELLTINSNSISCPKNKNSTHKKN